MKLNIACLLLVMLTSSCNKWLDLKPQDGITKQVFWKTKEDVKAALNGIYSSMIDGGVEQRIFLWGELRADMIDVTTYAPDDAKFVRNSNILTTNSISNWSAMYRTINNCNLLIDFAGQAKSSDPTFTDELYNSYVGEALTIRSLMYFYLVRAFRDVPLKLKGTYKDTDVVEIGKVTDKEVLAQIIADLIKAETMVPDLHDKSDPNAQVNKGRITKTAVNTLLADVYLWNEEYQKSVDATTKALGTDRYALINASGAWFDRVFLTGSSVETIFELNHKESVSNSFYAILRDARRSYVSSSWVATDIFPSNLDVDVELNDGRGQGIYFNSTSVIRKHGLDNPNYTNFQIYRYADLLMIRAEALNQLGRSPEALVLVKKLRESRNAIAATNLNPNPEDSERIAQFILEERAREFAFEGKRWFDLLRNAKRGNYTNINLLIELVSKISDVSVQQSAINKIKNIDSHYFPILESELYADTKLLQNPFYTK